MKGKRIFNWMIVLLAAAMLSSCGKDNKAGGDNNNNNSNPSNNVFTGSASQSSSFTGFINEVAAGKFQGGDLSVERRYVFQYYSSGDASNDDWFTFEFNYNSSSCYSYQECMSLQNQNYPVRLVQTNGNILRASSDTMFNDAGRFGGNLQSLKDNLLAKMRSATDIRMCINYYGRWQCGSENQLKISFGSSISTTRWQFRYGNHYYLVDTQYPLAANPIVIQDVNSGQGYQIIRY